MTCAQHEQLNQIETYLDAKSWECIPAVSAKLLETRSFAFSRSFRRCVDVVGLFKFGTDSHCFFVELLRKSPETQPE
jgi:hypothetical protein